MGGLKKIRTEGGQGGKLGHSNMAHWATRTRSRPLPVRSDGLKTSVPSAMAAVTLSPMSFAKRLPLGAPRRTIC